MTDRDRRSSDAAVALAATLHDPPGALLGLMRRVLPRLQAVYRQVAVATSPPTAPRVQAWLHAAGAWAGTPPVNARGPLYRTSVRRVLAGGAGHVHYLDFDRALHWMDGTPRELAAALRLARRQRVLVLGRTPKAHRLHHLPLYATEVVANGLMATRAGVSGRLDLLVPSFVLARAAATLWRRSRARDAGIYGEWAALLFGLAPEIGYLECRGLDWETPDRDPRGVRRLGLAAWRRRFETPAEWTLRVDMARAYLTSFERTLRRWPARAGTVRRLPVRAR